MKAFGLARIGRDAELRRTPSGESVINLSLAFSWGRKGEDGNRSTTWVDAALWGKRAESLSQHLVKGGLLMVSLEDVHIETFQKADGTPGSKLAARVTDVEFAGGGQGAGGQQQGGRDQGAYQQQAPQQQQRQAPQQRPQQPQQQRTAQQQSQHQGGGNGFDDLEDIPF